MPPIARFNLKENLKNKFVAFIDVMGFSTLVNNNNVENLESYFSKITEVLDNIRMDKDKIESFLISDSIILIAPNSLTGLKELFGAIRRIQSALLWRKILLRGAVSHGQIYYNKENNIVVGKGFIKAYLLEQQAVFPRVIIDPSIIKMVCKDRKQFIRKFNGNGDFNFERQIIYNRKQSKLNNDAIFIDYASFIIGQKSIRLNIKDVYETILENLYGDQKLYLKYTWLRDYFCETLEETWSELFDLKDPLNWTLHQKRLKLWIDKFNRL